MRGIWAAVSNGETDPLAIAFLASLANDNIKFISESVKTYVEAPDGQLDPNVCEEIQKKLINKINKI